MGETNPPPAKTEVEVPQKTEPIVQNVVPETEEAGDAGFGNFADFDESATK